MTMKDYSEKRDFHRMRVNSEIQITRSDGRILVGICRDLSATGMQLYVEEEVAVGEELLTLILSSDDNFPPFESSVRVLRADPEAEGFLLGTAIIEVKR